MKRLAQADRPMMRRAVLVLAALVVGSDARALWDQHQLDAQAGFSSVTDSNDGLDDSLVDALYQTGVSGVDDFAYKAHARADSRAGLLLVDSLVDWGPGAQYFHQSTTTIANLEEWLDVVDGGDPVTVTVQLELGISAQRANTASAQTTASVDIGSLCNVYVEIAADHDPVVSDGCTESYATVDFQASAGSGGISVTAVYDSGALPTHIDLHAQLESHLTVGGQNALDFAATTASGALSVEVAGDAGHSFGSPDFLAPEPDHGMLAGAALGALAAARRARGARGEA